jgi:hypothetical protein
VVSGTLALTLWKVSTEARISFLSMEDFTWDEANHFFDMNNFLVENKPERQ